MKKILLFFANNYKTVLKMALIAVLLVFLAANLIKDSSRITEKDLIERDEALTKKVMELTDAQIKQAYSRIEIGNDSLKNLSKSLDSINLVLENNKKQLNYNIYQLKKLKDDLKIGNYTNVSDSALLYRLRTAN